MSPVLTIGRLAARCGVSRTTLLYYERIGLLAPAARSAAGYRQYAEQDAARLEQVLAYRATGLTLEAIGALLADGDRPSLIQRRMDDINRDIARLREQQAVLVRLLAGRSAKPRTMNKRRWTALLRGAGMDDATMDRWHALFEQQAPDAHRDFLQSLGLDAAEVARIRRWSRGIPL
jgi:DNA-binding transcriptional MerR regulator